MTDHSFDTPDAILATITNDLQRGASSRKSGMHTMVVGTADGDMRVMVLRDYDAATRELRFHTDVRSPKIATMAARPAVHVLAYDPEAKVQIRMRGTARVESAGPVADAAWAESTNFAKRCYLAQAGPGSPADEPTSGLPEWAEGINPDDAQIADARENFAVVLVQVNRFDWLYLANSGHRRAQVVYMDGEPEFTWLVP